MKWWPFGRKAKALERIAKAAEEIADSIDGIEASYDKAHGLEEVEEKPEPEVIFPSEDFHDPR